jgi:ribosomal protein S12 methylthiotransferase accessory factor
MQAREAAQAAGVTRLADVTRLDRIGLPVWQAVRPMSRALSVHQGKGATPADAQLGALLEALESHRAEIFDRPGPSCPFDALPLGKQAPDPTDFARDRSAPLTPSQSYRWVEAEDWGSGESLFLPFDLVSLDLTRDLASPFDRGSDGIATATTVQLAAEAALQELIERDSVADWQTRGPVGCMADTLDVASVPFEWLRHWRERIEAAGASVRFYRVPSITASPVFVCEINDPSKGGVGYAAVHGQGCHSLPEIALFRALAEAIQSRATLIAGAREDALSRFYKPREAGRVAIAFALPPPPAMARVPWGEIAPGPVGCAALVEALARTGYDRIALVRLGEAEGLVSVKAFVCGLGSSERRRRLQ